MADHEIRLNEDGSVDEVVAKSPLYVHLEQMDHGAWSLIIGLEGNRQVMVSLAVKRHWRPVDWGEGIFHRIPCIDCIAEVEGP